MLPNINRNRYNKLHKIMPVIKLFIEPSIGVELSQWCGVNCEGLWNFANYYSTLRMCEFHFELKNDAIFFKLRWIGELNFTPEPNISNNNFFHSGY